MGWIDNIVTGLGIGRDLFGAYQQSRAESSSRNGIVDLLNAQNAARDQYRRDYLTWAEKENAANAAASAANARAAAAASAANQRNAMKAAKKALKTQKRYLEAIAGTYQPYMDAAKSLVPKSAENYGQFLDSTSLLNAYLMPKAQAVLSEAPKSAMSFAPAKGSVEVGVPQGGQVTFPNLNELLKRG